MIAQKTAVSVGKYTYWISYTRRKDINCQFYGAAHCYEVWLETEEQEEKVYLFFPPAYRTIPLSDMIEELKDVCFNGKMDKLRHHTYYAVSGEDADNYHTYCKIVCEKVRGIFGQHLFLLFLPKE